MVILYMFFRRWICAIRYISSDCTGIHYMVSEGRCKSFQNTELSDYSRVNCGTGLLVIRGLAGDNIRDYILGTLAGLAGMMLLYIIRAVGAGDVKLFAVLGLLTGLEFVVQLMVVSFITGLFIGVIELCFKRTSLVRVGSTGIEGHGFHYAVAVLIGYVVVLGYRVVVIL